MEKSNFNIGIEISDGVSNTATPKKIRRYDSVPKKSVKPKTAENAKLYRYRPGVNNFMTRDFDV